jgi:hypothetical protein
MSNKTVVIRNNVPIVLSFQVMTPAQSDKPRVRLFFPWVLAEQIAGTI